MSFVIVILTALLLPALRKPKANVKASKVICVNNLKQVGFAMRMWANDHGDQFSMSVSTNAGGYLELAQNGELFRLFQILSNELITPRILVCPSDSERSRIADFMRLTNGNISFFVGLDARKAESQTILSGDRNIAGGTLTRRGIIQVSTTNAVWGDNMHVKTGNLGLADGSVLQAAHLRRQLEQDQASRRTNVTRLAIP